jgi:hypothetical protein
MVPEHYFLRLPEFITVLIYSRLKKFMDAEITKKTSLLTNPFRRENIEQIRR